MNSPLEEIVAEALRSLGATLAVAESCTGGLLAKTLTDVPGASAFFRGGAVTYATDAKTDVLGVPAALIARFGVVGPECAEAMARGAAEKFRADFALSTTGIAGPGGGTKATPVGTVFIGLRTPAGTRATRFSATGTTRAEIRAEAVAAALELLADALGTRGFPAASD